MTSTEIQKAPSMLIELAIEKGAGVEELSKLMDLQERWDKQQSIKAFKQAFVDFQGDKPEIHWTSKAHNSRYASLPNIQKAVDPVLSMHGLSYRWEQSEVEDRISITCIISHVLGHEERTAITAPKDKSGSKNDVQSIGSTVSYLKRYTLEAALGLSTDKDDDGGARKPKEKEELTPKHPKWKGAKEAVASGEITIEKIETRFILSEANKKKLLEI